MPTSSPVRVGRNVFCAIQGKRRFLARVVPLHNATCARVRRRALEPRAVPLLIQRYTGDNLMRSSLRLFLATSVTVAGLGISAGGCSSNDRVPDRSAPGGILSGNE